MQRRDITILIIDDDEIAILILENMLRREGFKTIKAVTATEGATVARSRIPDLILLDVNLPDGRGPQICRTFKTDPVTTEIPVLFLSADASVESKIECFDAGGVDYVTKPFEPREVIARLKMHLRLREAHKLAIEMAATKMHDIMRAQNAILPPDPSDFPEAKFSAFYRQLSGAGGDFYEIIRLDATLFDYIVVDVCGHDIGSSMVTAALKALFAQNCSILHSPAEILSIVNKAIPSVLQRNQFVTVSWVRLNRLTGMARVINSGQPPIIIISENRRIDLVDTTGALIGVFDPVAFETVEKSVKPGDRFILYSDGLIESGEKTPSEREREIARLADFCLLSADRPLPLFIEGIKKFMFENSKPNDDVVVLGVDA